MRNHFIKHGLPVIFERIPHPCKIAAYTHGCRRLSQCRSCREPLELQLYQFWQGVCMALSHISNRGLSSCEYYTGVIEGCPCQVPVIVYGYHANTLGPVDIDQCIE